MDTSNLDYNLVINKTFEKIQKGIFELNQNIEILEKELSDAHKLLYEKNDEHDVKVIKTLEDIAGKWTHLCEDLEERIKQDELEIDKVTKELDVGKGIVLEHENKMNELQNFLVEQNLVMPVEDPSDAKKEDDSLIAEHNSVDQYEENSQNETGNS